MTKVEAIEQVMINHGGTASLSMIYDEICKYYPTAKDSKDWDAGLRGVLYREIKNQRRFKKIGLSIYALAEYQEQVKPQPNETIRMHSFIEGICIELGNFKNFNTYTADPSAIYRDNVHLGSLTTIKEMPSFSYPEIITETKRIDVVWLNKKGLLFPQKIFEVVDSIGTLNGAFNRSLQLKNLLTEFYVVAPESHHEKYEQTLNLEIYRPSKDRFRFINYDDIIQLYDTVSRTNKLESQLLG